MKTQWTPLYKFVEREMRRRGISHTLVEEHIRDGLYPVRVRWKGNHKFVQRTGGRLPPTQIPRKGEITLKRFVFEESIRLKQGLAATYKQIRTGKRPDIRVRRVNEKVVFVSPRKSNGQA